MRLRVQNFRKLASLDWEPQGVCILVGPNGAGKTTVLQALRFMHAAWTRGMSHAVRFSGGSRAFRTRNAAADAPVELELSDGGSGGPCNSSPRAMASTPAGARQC